MQVRDAGLHLRQHGAGSELAFLDILRGLGHGQHVEVLLVRRVEVDGHLRHRGEDDQHVGLEVGRQLGAGAVFVDDGRHAAIPAVLLDDGHAAASCGHHEVAVVHEILDGIELHDAHRRGRSHHLAPAAAGVLLERGARLVRKTHGLVFSKKRAHGLRGILERGVVRVDHRLGNERHRRAHDVATLELVQDGLGQLVADVSLAHGAALGQRHGRRLAVMGVRVVERVLDHADLRPVAMGHDDVHALAHHVDDVRGGVLHQLELLLRRVAQGVAAEGDDHGLAGSFLIGHGKSFLIGASDFTRQPAAAG